MNNAPPGLLLFYSDLVNSEGIAMTVNDTISNTLNQSPMYSVFAKTSPSGEWESVKIQ